VQSKTKEGALTSFQGPSTLGGRNHKLVGTYSKRGHKSSLVGTSFEKLHYKLEDKIGLYQVPCVFTCCSIFFQISNIYLSLLLVFPMGVFLGYCLFSIFSGRLLKILEGIVCFKVYACANIGY
jgi:hypothetical protein